VTWQFDILTNNNYNNVTDLDWIFYTVVGRYRTVLPYNSKSAYLPNDPENYNNNAFWFTFKRIIIIIIAELRKLLRNIPFLWDHNKIPKHHQWITFDIINLNLFVVFVYSTAACIIYWYKIIYKLASWIPIWFFGIPFQYH